MRKGRGGMRKGRGGKFSLMSRASHKRVPRASSTRYGETQDPGALDVSFASLALGPGSRCARPGRKLRVHLDHHAFRENLLHLGMAMRDALLVHIAQELLEGRAVLLDPERKRIAAEHVAHAARIDRQPWQRIARHRLLEHARMGAVLRFIESVVETARHPWI